MGPSVFIRAGKSDGEIADARHAADVGPKKLAEFGKSRARCVWVTGTRARWEIYGDFLPMNETHQSRKLLSAYLESCAAVGLQQVKGEKAGGAADSGFAAATGTPTLCGQIGRAACRESVRQHVSIPLPPASLHTTPPTHTPHPHT